MQPFQECRNLVRAIITSDGLVQCLCCVGKTSLLNALSGKAGYGVVSGIILVNGEEDTLEKYKRVMGFVPQDDIMHTDLTVEENLLFSARYRLPAGTSHSTILSVVERAIQVMREEIASHTYGWFWAQVTKVKL